jgi:hypothetical protein
MRIVSIIILFFAFFIAGCGHLLTSGGVQKAIMINEKEFYQYKMFFLDTVYKNFYLKRCTTAPDVKTERLQIWLSNVPITWGVNARDSSDKNTYRYFGAMRQPFRLLERGRDYDLDRRWKGVIRFDSLFVTNEDLLGIHLETEDSTVIPNKGVYWDSRDTSQIIKDTLWTLKFPIQDPSYPTFSLVWRNVYVLPSRVDITNFSIHIVLARDSTIERAPDGRLFTDVMGLSDKNGAVYSSDRFIFDAERSMLIFPAFDSSISGNEPFSNPALGADNTNPGIYKIVGNDFNLMPWKFKIQYIRTVQE